ncbi:MAG: diguanylate cyclase [Phycisphaerales bacterium]|nr:diguanylate cyclase [Phycisphaerales bacterium]
MTMNATPAPERQQSVLLIDPAPEVHRMLSMRLREDDIALVAAMTGEEGLELAESHQPSAIILELHLPRMSGFDLLRRLKSNPATMHAPVIMLTASEKAEDKVRAFELGATDYVCKPFNMSELRARIGGAMRIRRLLHLLEQRAQIDGMTGLWNRAYFNDKLAAEIAHMQRTGEPLALAICDLDKFKHLNDTLGHPFGDVVIQGFAQLLLRQLRSYDVACRYGGEEFALILPSATLEEAFAACDRIRRTLEARTWPGQPDLVVTASFGLADCGLDSMTNPASWIEAADRSLYSAKESGRNRVHVFDARLGAGREMKRMAA